MFSCNKATRSVFETQKGINAFFYEIGLRAVKFSCHKPKHSFGNIEHQKYNLVTNKEETVVLRKIMLKTAEPSQKQAKTLF